MVRVGCKATWSIGPYLCMPQIFIIIITIIIIFISYAIRPISSLQTVLFPLSLSRLPTQVNRRQNLICIPPAGGCVTSSYHHYF